MNRRKLLKAGVSAAAAAIFGDSSAFAVQTQGGQQRSSESGKPFSDRLCLFTDHVDDSGYSYQDVASMLRQLGVAGPDLTVRPGGLISPERVAEELPKAATVFGEHGLSIPMVSTAICQPDEQAKSTLTTMSKLGIRYYKLGYYHYHDVTEWEHQLKSAQTNVAELVEIGKSLGVEAGIHNHAGPTVGGVLWDLVRLLEPFDAKWVGSYFDPAHATIEGGNFGWKLNFQRLSQRLKMIAVKDFIWEKVGGRWQTRWCPLGEGLVRWTEFFAMLARIPFDGPISLHIEYDIPGSTRAVRFENSLAAAERDLAFLTRKLADAKGTPNQ